MGAKSALRLRVLGAAGVLVLSGCGSRAERTAAMPKRVAGVPASPVLGDIPIDVGVTDAPPVPAPVIAPPPLPVRRPGAYANLDPDDDYVLGPPDPYADCETELAQSGVKFHAASIPVHVAPKAKFSCGAPQVVAYIRGPGSIAYNAAPIVTCTMALALASFERILQKEAIAIFGSPVARIEQLGTYNCRVMSAYPTWVSEHSYANAIDIGSFTLKNGKTVEVLRDFDVGDAPPTKPAAAFLRVVSRRANDEDVFSHVLTPFFDRNHRNHFHLDLSRYRADGTRPQGVD
jgi:hypothetical protein